MPVYEHGDMWSVFDTPNTVFVFTANSTVKSNGALVMGRGIALAVRIRLEGIDLALGRIISAQQDPDDFGFVILDYHGKRIGAFQVKTYYGDSASLQLIRRSADKLGRWSIENLATTVHMNFPGIGYGRLYESAVLPMITSLPENVHIWKNGNPATGPSN